MATSFLLLSLKWAVPTRYRRLPSGAVRQVTVSGSSGDDCRRWARNCQSISIASPSARQEQQRQGQKNRREPMMSHYIYYDILKERYIFIFQHFCIAYISPICISRSFPQTTSLLIMEKIWVAIVW